MLECTNMPAMPDARMVSKKWTPLDKSGDNAAKLLDTTECFFHMTERATTHVLIAIGIIAIDPG